MSTGSFQCRSVHVCFALAIFLVLALWGASVHAQTFTFTQPGAAGGERAGLVNSTNSGCLHCHGDYDTNHHPVDFYPSRAINTSVFPLYGGRVRCLTCHVPDHGKGGKLLRGGPYSDRRVICFKCHPRDEYAGLDPHVMLDSNGKIREINGMPVCLVCHALTPDPRKSRANDVFFKADVAFLCWRCHAPMVSPIFDEHFLTSPSPAMSNYIARSVRDLKVMIPLIPRNRITCSTCHNPHQKGVILFGPSAKGADAQHRLRLPMPELCKACHNV